MAMYNRYIYSFTSVLVNLVPLKCIGLVKTLIFTAIILNQIPMSVAFSVDNICKRFELKKRLSSS